ncbi:MAG: hypothetical protein AL399_04370 [Candidatus [Bacteroides] periocalifornicus]|uniref:Uncharacterized protein n=1 Tax=Candidatus [Bacteroides] periocalifornicus TaxID=1702214 RepID=A0A0Q4B8N6_9BACT|nr:MAG: hypothetical protein AL399_04370 [Candidatus [Bacteroides] periocalifornicus]
MEKVMHISLGGYSFTVDQEGYQLLRGYLDSLIARFGSGAEGREVLQSIEERLAELLSGTPGFAVGCLTADAVRSAIEQIGTPDDIAPEAVVNDHEQAERYHQRLRLYRDPDHRVFGGVCAGLGLRVGVSPWIFRLLFIVGTCMYGAGILVYIVLWLAIPKAVTPLQKMEMKGEPLTFDRLQDEIRSQYQNLRGEARDGRRMGGRSENVFLGLLSLLGTALLGLLRVLVMVVGATLVVASAVGAVGMLIGAFAMVRRFDTELLGDFGQTLGSIVGTYGLSIPWVLLIELVVLIPLGFLFVLGLRCLTRFRVNRVASLIALGVWVAALVGLGVLAVHYDTGAFYNTQTVSREYPLRVRPGDTVTLVGVGKALGKTDGKRPRKSLSFRQLYGGMVKVEEMDRLVELEVRATDDSVGTLQVKRQSFSLFSADQFSLNHQVRYRPTLSGDTIRFPMRYSMRQMPSGYVCWVSCRLYLPEGVYLRVDPTAVDLIENDGDVWFYRDIDSNGGLWVARNGVLHKMRDKGKPASLEDEDDWVDDVDDDWSEQD